MIESISDAVQLAVLAACFAVSLGRALRGRDNVWITLTSFFACMLLGNAYWLGYQLVFGDDPHYSLIADMSWVAGYAFLVILAVELDRKRGVSAPVPIAWIPVAVCAACCIFYIVDSGSIALNIADNGLLAAVGFFAVRGVVASDAPDAQPVASDARSITPITRPAERPQSRHLAGSRPLHASLLAFVAVEQALWLASCFTEYSLIASVEPYIVLNYALTLSYAAILACAWRPGRP